MLGWAGGKNAMNALERLRQQHRHVGRLFEVLERGEGDLVPVLDELATQLPAHMAVEHACVYPAAGVVDARSVAEAYEEHAIVELALKRLLITPLGTEEFRARVTVLTELVLNHIKEEEADLFPILEEKLGTSVLEALGAEMHEMMDLLLAEGPAHAPVGGSGTFPIVGGEADDPAKLADVG